MSRLQSSNAFRNLLKAAGIVLNGTNVIYTCNSDIRAKTLAQALVDVLEAMDFPISYESGGFYIVEINSCTVSFTAKDNFKLRSVYDYVINEEDGGN